MIIQHRIYTKHWQAYFNEQEVRQGVTKPFRPDSSREAALIIVIAAVVVVQLVAVNLPDWKEWTGATFFLSIRNTVIAIQVVSHLPAPVFLPRHGHRRPPVDPHVVVPDLPLTDVASNDRECTFMTTPHLVIGICCLGAIGVEVAAHWWTGSLP